MATGIEVSAISFAYWLNLPARDTTEYTARHRISQPYVLGEYLIKLINQRREGRLPFLPRCRFLFDLSFYVVWHNFLVLNPCGFHKWQGNVCEKIIGHEVLKYLLNTGMSYISLLPPARPRVPLGSLRREDISQPQMPPSFETFQYSATFHPS